MLSAVRDANPEFLCRAICVVYGRWAEHKLRDPGSDNIVNATRTSRPALVAEIEKEWQRIAKSDPAGDWFPYHESYVIRKWIQFRKNTDPFKAALINTARRLDIEESDAAGESAPAGISHPE